MRGHKVYSAFAIRYVFLLHFHVLTEPHFFVHYRWSGSSRPSYKVYSFFGIRYVFLLNFLNFDRATPFCALLSMGLFRTRPNLPLFEIPRSLTDILFIKDHLLTLFRSSGCCRLVAYPKCSSIKIKETILFRLQTPKGVWGKQNMVTWSTSKTLAKVGSRFGFAVCINSRSRP